MTFTVKANGAAAPANTPVTFTANPNFTNLPNTAQNTDASGQITVANLTATTVGAQTLSATVDGKTVDVTFTVAANISSISIDAFTNGGNFVATGSSTASVTALVKDASGNALSGATVTWSVLSASNNSPAMYSGFGAKKTGLTWGATATMVKYDDVPELTATTSLNTDANGKTMVQLTDIVGERSITLQAKVTLSGTEYTATQVVSFGNGPLSVFRAPDATSRNWAAAYQHCNGSAPSGTDVPSTWTVADNGVYHGGGQLPTRAEYQAVAPIDTRYGFTNPNGNAKGAAYAAGWPDSYYRYWTGEAYGAGSAFYVRLGDGYVYGFSVGSGRRVACRR